MRLPSIISLLQTTTLFLHPITATAATFSTRDIFAFTTHRTTSTTAVRHHSSSRNKYTVPTMTTSSNDDSTKSQNLYLSTPLILSQPLTNLCNRPIYLKLDSLQPSGSFKDRGMAHLCTTLRSTKGTTRLISSSGGNAGLAVATVGSKLGMDVQVIVPQTTKELVLQKLRGLGADVTVHGANWNEADVLARQRAGEDDEAEYVSPYDDPLLWTGHSTVVDEIVLSSVEESIGAIIASVGGGGLICGILEGVSRHNDVL
eukprot:11963267-Ditylum_brightwellii.AAC.1